MAVNFKASVVSAVKYFFSRPRTKLISFMAAIGLIASAPPVFANTLTVGTANSESCGPFGCNGDPFVGVTLQYFQFYHSGAFVGPITFDTITFFNISPPLTESLYANYNITFSISMIPPGASSAILVNTATFFNASFGDPNPPHTAPSTLLSIIGMPYTYDPSLGDLVLRVVPTNQSIYYDAFAQLLTADNSGLLMTSIVSTTRGNTASNLALVTQFSNSSETPLPAALSLFATGLGTLGLLGWRRKRKQIA